MGQPHDPPLDGLDERWRLRRRRDRRLFRGVLGPVLLILLGVIFLLQNAGVLDSSVWSGLWHLWPALLVLAGLEVLLGTLVTGAIFRWLAVALAVVGLVAVLVASAWYARGSALVSSRSQPSYMEQTLQGATQAQIGLQFGAGDLTVGALPSSKSSQLAGLTFNGLPQFRPEPVYRLGNNGTGELTFTYRDGQNPSGRTQAGFPFFNGSSSQKLDLQLTPSVPLQLNLQTGAATSHIDLSALHVADLTLEAGASTTWLRLPESAGTTTVRIKGGATTMNIEIPQGVAAQIRYQGGLSTLNVDKTRFPSAGGQLYRSANYDSAQNRVDLTLEAGVSTVSIR